MGLEACPAVPLPPLLPKGSESAIAGPPEGNGVVNFDGFLWGLGKQMGLQNATFVLSFSGLQ